MRTLTVLLTVAVLAVTCVNAQNSNSFEKKSERIAQKILKKAYRLGIDTTIGGAPAKWFRIDRVDYYPIAVYVLELRSAEDSSKVPYTKIVFKKGKNWIDHLGFCLQEGYQDFWYEYLEQDFGNLEKCQKSLGLIEWNEIDYKTFEVTRLMPCDCPKLIQLRKLSEEKCLLDMKTVEGELHK